jgi:hypothetical protein
MKKISAVLIGIIFAVNSFGSTAPGWIVDQISQSGYVNNDCGLQISGQYAAWQEYVNGTYQMKLWDGSSIKTISDPNQECEEPHMYGNKVTWRQSGRVIMLYDGTSTYQISQQNYCYGPRISQNNVTWVEQINGIYSIMLWKDGTACQISSGSCRQPVIDGTNVAWFPDVGSKQLIFYNGSNASTLYTSNNFCGDLQISGSKLAWLENEADYPEHRGGAVYFWNGTTVQKLSSRSDCTSPQIWDSNVVWIEGNQVMHFNGATTTALTANSKQKSNLRIWKNLVAWNEKPQDLAVWLIYIYDGTTKTKLTDMPGCRLRAISDGNISWTAYNDDYDLSVMFAHPGTLPAPLLGDINNDSAVNMADFSIFASNWMKTK